MTPVLPGALTIVNTEPADLETVQGLFDLAIAYQRSRSGDSWRGMDRPLIEREIADGLHWKGVEGGEIACFFSIAFTDELVWGERDAEASVYLHRIVTNPAYRGRGYVHSIVEWAEAFGRGRGLRYIRLDTHRDNGRLNSYYTACGFDFCGVRVFDGSEPGVPPHYLGSGLSLYEKRIGPGI